MGLWIRTTVGGAFGPCPWLRSRRRQRGGPLPHRPSRAFRHAAAGPLVERVSGRSPGSCQPDWISAPGGCADLSGCLDNCPLHPSRRSCWLIRHRRGCSGEGARCGNRGAARLPFVLRAWPGARIHPVWAHLLCQDRSWARQTLPRTSTKTWGPGARTSNRCIRAT